MNTVIYVKYKKYFAQNNPTLDFFVRMCIKMAGVDKEESDDVTWLGFPCFRQNFAWLSALFYNVYKEYVFHLNTSFPWNIFGMFFKVFPW